MLSIEFLLKNNKAKKYIPSAPPEIKEETDIPTYTPPERFCITTSVPGFQIDFLETFYDDTATFDYENLSYTLCSLYQYCEFSFNKNGTLDLSFTNKAAFLSDTALIKLISKIGKRLIMETINTYTASINFQLKQFDENELSESEHEKYLSALKKNSHSNSWEYLLTYQSSCLLQSLFLATADMLNEYGVGTCKYPGCNKTFLYKLTRPKSCCNHKHIDNYSKLKKRNSPKLYNN